MRQQGEPSVEEILDSIKKVIARDNRANGYEQQALRANPERSREGLTRQDIEEDVLDLAVSAQFLDADAPESRDSALLGEQTRSSMRESLAALAMMAQPSPAPQIVRQGETSLESLTREVLRPMLAEWLDKHLPPMVERMVADEIARIVGKKG